MNQFNEEAQRKRKEWHQREHRRWLEHHHAIELCVELMEASPEASRWNATTEQLRQSVLATIAERCDREDLTIGHIDFPPE